MSKNSKAKSNDSASSKKVKQFKVSPLIFVIAIVEVIILIGVLSYGWFVLATNNQVDSGLIEVAPDSGLRIDFKDADNSNYINIWNYLKDFNFEPGTSTDGKNIFFPTTGTFNQTDTKEIKFREGTVNDVNSKYVAVDFTLTNTGEETAKVYLDNKSTFTVKKANEEDTTGKALRIAFYQNDNKSGKVSSGALKKLSQDQANICTVYFYNSEGWATPSVHIWHEQGTTDPAYTTWPGNKMKHIAGDIYYYSFINYENSTAGYYDSIIFDDGSTNNQTVDLSLTNGNIYSLGAKSGSKYTASSVAYSNYVSDSGYAVIAPGVSAGFQRPYAPVVSIDDDTGAPTTIVPAFADSIDEFYTFENVQLFEIPKDQTQSLTMIIWLEGTDDDCVASTYAGDKIDLNLIFNKSDDRNENYTYKFIDATKENWIDDTVTDKQTGLTFKPVIQLYDKTDHRGYLMSLKNGNEWTVSATQKIVSAKHEIEFRRVNPNDENEIWNKWDASEVMPQDIFSSAAELNTTYTYANGKTVTQPTVYFTAFADGAPARGTSGNNNLPVHSCGGLWGKFNTSELIYVNQTSSQISEGSDNNQPDGKALTINYTYYYDAKHSQVVEYKGSPSYASQLHYFVVPNNILASTSDYEASYTGSDTPTYRFKVYKNFNNYYALNINDANRNPTVAYDSQYSVTSHMTHPYAMTFTTGSTETLFGKDIMYVRIKCKDPDFYAISNSSDKATFQLHCFDGVSKYINLRYSAGDSALIENDYVTYPVVVPEGTGKFQVFRKDKNYNTQYNKTDDITWDSAKNTFKVTSYGSGEYMNYNYTNNSGYP